MQHSLKLAFCGLIFLSVISCQKGNFKDAGRTVPRSLTEDSIRALLKSATWKYYEYFSGYDLSTTQLVWKIGKSNNTLNLSLNRVTYLTDSTYTETDENGNIYYGTWSLLNGGAQIQVVNPVGTYTSDIQKLTNDEFQWYEPASGHYGFMVPENQVSDTTGGRLALLTAHVWVYDEYFNQYNSSPTNLIFKSGKSNSPLNLSLNQAQFNTNGTYWEIDQNGNYISGTWTFLNGQTQLQVSNYLGVFTSDIRQLDTKRLEWQDVAGSVYGEEVAQ